MNIIAPVNITAEAPWGTRAGPATYWDRSGTLQSAAANALRVTYDPLDLTSAPYPLIETVAATNGIRNNTMQGAVIGAPGTLPTNWSVVKNSVNLSHEVADVSSENGINYIDLRIVGTYGGSGVIQYGVEFDAPSAIAAAINQRWIASVFAKIVAGMTAAIDSLQIAVVSYRADGTLWETSTSGYGLSDKPLRACRRSWARTFASADTAFAGFRFYVTFKPAGGVTTNVDLTVRVGLPQMEMTTATDGAVPSAPIKTTNAAVLRAADVVGTAPGMLYSNLAENDVDDAPLWQQGQAVAKDQYRRRAETHKVYRALQAVPTSGDGLAAPEYNPRDGSGNPYWLEWEPTNRWAAYDSTLDTPSAGGEILQWVVRPGQIVTALAALAMDATEIRIGAVTHTGAIVYRRTRNLVLKTSRSWTDFLFKQIERRSDEALLDLPPFKTVMLCVTVYKPGSTAKVGDVKIGRREEIGELQIEPEVRTLRRSTIKDNGYGRMQFTKRPSSKLLNCNVWIDGSRVDTVTELINKYTAEPCVIVGDDRFSSLIILGFVQDFRVTLDTADSALYNLQAQGLG